MIWVVKREVRMATKRHSAEQIVRKLREAEVELAKGEQESAQWGRIMSGAWPLLTQARVLESAAWIGAK